MKVYPILNDSKELDLVEATPNAESETFSLFGWRTEDNVVLYLADEIPKFHPVTGEALERQDAPQA